MSCTFSLKSVRIFSKPFLSLIVSRHTMPTIQFLICIKLFRKTGLEPVSAAPKNDDEVSPQPFYHWTTSHSISFQLLTMTKKLHHRFWRHLFNLYNSAQSHHSPSLNLTECFNNFTGAPEGIRTLKTSVLSRRCLPVASRTHLIGGDYGSWNPFWPFLSTAAQEISIETLPEILTSANPHLKVR